MYKSGKLWVYAAITTTIVMAGTANFNSVSANDNQTDSTPTSEQQGPSAPSSDGDKLKAVPEKPKEEPAPTDKDVKKETTDKDEQGKVLSPSSPVKNEATSEKPKETKKDETKPDTSKSKSETDKNKSDNYDKNDDHKNAAKSLDDGHSKQETNQVTTPVSEQVYLKKDAIIYADAESEKSLGKTNDYNVSAVITNQIINGRVHAAVVMRNGYLEGYVNANDFTATPQAFNDSYGSSHYTRWDMDQIPGALNNPDFRAPQYDKSQLDSNILSAKIVDPTTHEEKQIFVWDSWPLQDPNGKMANYHGYYIVLGLTAPEGVDQNGNAKIGAFAQKIGVKDDGIASWQYLGNIFATHLDGSNNDEYLKNLVGEWSGSSIMLNPNDETIRVFYTNAAPVPNGNQQVLTTAEIAIEAKDGNYENGLVINHSKTKDHKSIFAGDGEKYQKLGQLSGAVNGFPDNFCLRDPHYVESNGHKYLVFEGNTGTETGYQGINNIYNKAYFGGDDAYFTKSHDWLKQFPGSLEYGKAINANAALGIVELNDDFTVKKVMNPLLTANAVNDEFERPDIFEHNGKWYLFTVNRGERMASSTANVTGDTHNYMSYMMGFVSENGIDGEYKPLNGNGLVLASDISWDDPNFMYSFYVIPPLDQNSNDFVITSYLGNRSFAPSFLMQMDGYNTKILNYKVLNQGAVVNSENYYNAEAQPTPVFDGASINDGTVISISGYGPHVVIPPKPTEATKHETPKETVDKVVEKQTPNDFVTPGRELPVNDPVSELPKQETKRSGTTHFATLPLTGQSNDATIMSLIGLAILSFLGLFGLGKRRN